MSFGDTLTKLRKEHGLNRQQLADELGVPYTTLRNYETGAREPGHKFLIQAAKYFNVSIDYLLGMEETKKVPLAQSQGDLKKVLVDFLGLDPAQASQAQRNLSPQELEEIITLYLYTPPALRTAALNLLKAAAQKDKGADKRSIKE